jgi:hypothetical protein
MRVGMLIPLPERVERFCPAHQDRMRAVVKEELTRRRLKMPAEYSTESRTITSMR